MRMGFVLFKYFPFGGLQRDMLRIALACRDRGHEVRVYCLSWQGEVPEGIRVETLPLQRLTNRARYEAFYRQLQPLLERDGIEGVVGFNKLPGLDLYYAADPCFREKWLREKNWLTRLGARNRLFLAY